MAQVKESQVIEVLKQCYDPEIPPVTTITHSELVGLISCAHLVPK